MSFYFDESGHSGDAVKSGNAYDFLDQPFFVLAALGIDDDAAFQVRVEEVKLRHRLPMGELKAKSLQHQPAFVADLILDVFRSQRPLFVEIVDKRFFICMNMLTHQLLAPVMGYPSGPQMHFLKNVAVDFLYDQVSDHVLDRFVDACVRPSDEALMSVFGSQLALLSESRLLQSDIGKGMREMVMEAAIAYDDLRKSDASVCRRFLPPPDLNRHNKQVWMLPNLSSFANIYARINLFNNRRLAGVRLVHDQQLEIENILRDAKGVVEGFKDMGFDEYMPSSDYTFTEQAVLEFAESHDSVGIQVADVIAGTVMRFFRDRLRSPQNIHPEIAKAMDVLRKHSNEATGYGLNQVVPHRGML